MNTFTVTTMIKRPVKEVFDFMTNPDNNVKWQNGTVSAKYVSKGPVGVGSIVHSVGKLMGRELAIDGEVTQWAPPNLWGIKVSNGPMKFEGMNKFESKDGGTLITQSFQGEVGGFFKLAEGMAIKQMQKQVEGDGQRLKKLLESK